MTTDRISPAVRAAMSALPRERFVPRSMRRLADIDEPLPIGYGQTISQPTVVGIMTTALSLTGAERVLEIGTGSGFQTAVLAALAKHVFTVELIEPLAIGAQQTLSELEIAGVSFRIGDGHLGWPEQAPFDRIICTAAPPKLPKSLLSQLTDGGILVAPVGRQFQELVRVVRHGDQIRKERLGAVRFVPMVHSEEE